MKLSLARIFSDHMVLQRNRPVAVFGAAPAGETVRAELNGCAASTVAGQDGRWLLRLPPMDARGSLVLRVTCGQEEIALRDVVLGEVWLAGGQSNMEFELYKAKGGFADIQSSDDCDLRYYQVEQTESNEERGRVKCPAPEGWVASGPEYAAQFSAVAFYFAQRLRKALDVPVGIVGCSWGGTSASCWLSRENLCSDKALEIYLQDYERDCGGRSEEEYLRIRAEYDAQVAQYESELKALRETVKEEEEWRAKYDKLVYPWPPPMGDRCFMRPNGLYETMVRYAAPYTLRGALWYQGEGDTQHAELYARLLGKVIEQWRGDFLDPELFLGVVQLTGFAGEDGTQSDWGVLRAQQQLAVERAGHAALAVIYDVGQPENIHPIEKRTVGNRLADQILSRVYGQDIDAALAALVEVKERDGALTLTFSEPLTAAEGVRGFQLCDKAGVWREAQGSAQGNAVTLRCAEKPAAVRYAYTNWTDANVYQKNGIPLPPFERTL